MKNALRSTLIKYIGYDRLIKTYVVQSTVHYSKPELRVELLGHSIQTIRRYYLNREL